MTGHRRITPIIAGFAVIPLIAAPAACASSLLSGYGGPGEGNQAILGSALLNGPRGGGSGGGSAGGGSSAGEGGSTPARASELAAPSGSSGGVSESRATPPRTPGARGQPRSTRLPRASSRTGAHIGAFAGYTASERADHGHSWLGISGEDLLFVLLALGVLALSAALTGRSAGATRTHADSRGAG